jgi:peptidoglycan/LPS O-acetylase OafA/YrhL
VGGGEIRALTSLRFFAAFVVLLFHFSPEWPDPWSAIVEQGHVGVTIFFVLSGFLITARYGERLARGEVRLGEYFCKRAARILPLYYALLAVSLMLAPGESPFEMRRVPEWTLTQGLFGESIHALALPTSWSLTVEECFYAVAPLVLLSITALRRRMRPTLAAALALCGWTVGLYAVGTAIAHLTPSDRGFLGTPAEMTIHTLFGRFFEFAVGTACALAWPAFQRAWARPRGTVVAALLSVLSVLAIFLGQIGFARAGGIEAARWAPMWAWDLLLAPAAGVLILSLTCTASPIARLLSVAPLPYLGRISYALYLVQMSPIGKGVLYPLLPRHGALTLVALYVGLIAISAACYEAIEEPARRLVLRILRFYEAPAAARSGRRAHLAAVAGLALVVGTEVAYWGLATLDRTRGPVTVGDVRAAAPPSEQITQNAALLTRRRGALLLNFPRAWREGWRDDVRAPSALMVFVDGVRVPFSRREPAGTGPAAFFRGPRAELLAVRVTDGAQVTVVRARPALVFRVHAARLLRAPLELELLLILCFTAAALVLRTLHGRDCPPRTLLAHAAGSAVVWCAFDADLWIASPLVLALHVAALGWWREASARVPAPAPAR